MGYYTRSLKIYGKNKNMVASAVIYYEISKIYLSQRQFNKALEYNYKVLNISKELKDTINIINNLYNIGSIYNNKNNKKDKKKNILAR